jgi:ABC-type nitrate/sulfonate/bicarbonate transport system permease component
MDAGQLFRARDKKILAIVNSSEENIFQIKDNKYSSSAKKLLIFISGILFVIFIWYLVAGIYNAFFSVSVNFPDPATTFERLWKFLSTNYKILGASIYTHLTASLGRWFQGFLTAFAIGMVLGTVLGSNERLYQFGIVPVNVLQLIPGLAWYPVTILLFGFGEDSAIFIIAITAISPIAINIANGFRRVPKVNMRVARMSGRSRLETFTEVLIPFSALDILAGLRIGMANGWRMLITAEMIVGVAVGLGYAIQTTTAYLDYPAAFASIVLICVIGLLIDKVILAPMESYVRRKVGAEGG